MSASTFRNWMVQCLVSILLIVPAKQVSAEDTRRPDEASMGLALSGDQAKSLEELKRGFSLFPYDTTIRKRLIDAYVILGKQQLKGMLFDEAADSFDNARRLSPDNQDLGVLKGIALYAGRHYDAAAVELEQARRNGGDTLPILLYLGRVYYDTGELSKAVETWDMAIALDPANRQINDLAAKARRELAIESGMEKDFGSIFVISYDEGSRSDLADAVLDVLESAYNEVGYDLSYYPETQIPVILYTRKDYRNVTRGPEWSGGMYDGKVRLPIGGAREISPILRGVLYHEYTHVVVGGMTKGNCPAWLNEGLAEMEGRKSFSPPATELEAAAKSGNLIPFSGLENSFSNLDSRKAALAYQQSYSLVTFMVSSYGMYKVRDILVNLGKGMDSSKAIAAAFSDFRLDLEGIVREWQEHMQREHGSD